MQYRKSTRPYDSNFTTQLIYYFPIFVNLFDFERRKCVKWKGKYYHQKIECFR